MISTTSWGGRNIPGAPGYGSLHNRSLELASLLDGGDGKLSRILRASDERNFDQALKLLSEEDRAVLARKAGGSLTPWISLSQENQADIFNHGKLHLAERAGRGVRRGEDSWGQQLARGLIHGVQQAGHPALWAGMAAGGIAFRLGRIAGMRGMAAWGVRGPAFSLASGMSGLTMEAGAFVFVSQTMRSLQGEERTRSWSDDFAGIMLSLGCLRLSGYAADRLYRGVHAMPANHVGLASGAFQTGGMYLGLVGSHYAAMRLGWEPPRPLGSVLAGAGAELFTFSLGARVARSVLGPRFGNWERELEMRGRAWATQANISGRVFYPEAEGLLLMSVGKGDGAGGPKGPRPTRSYSLRGKVLKARENANIQSQEELLAWIRGETGYLREQILSSESHMTFHLHGSASLDLLKIRNELNLLSYLPQLPRGRRIRIAFEDGTPPADFIKLGNVFVKREGNLNGAPKAAIKSKMEAAAADINHVAQKMDRISTRPWTQLEGRYPDLSHFPVFLSSYEGLRSYLAVAKARFSTGDYGPLVLRGLNPRVKDLDNQTRNLGAQLPVGTHLEIWSTEKRQTFVGRREGVDIRWVAHNSRFWEFAAQTPKLSPATARNPLELYLQLHFLSSDPLREARTVTVIRYDSPKPPMKGLKEMILLALNELSPQGSELLVEFAGNSPSWRFVRENGSWKFE